jgi:hypothetical protein
MGVNRSGRSVGGEPLEDSEPPYGCGLKDGCIPLLVVFVAVVVVPASVTVVVVVVVVNSLATTSGPYRARSSRFSANNEPLAVSWSSVRIPQKRSFAAAWIGDVSISIHPSISSLPDMAFEASSEAWQ